MLNDGQWHMLSEIQREAGLNDDQVRKLADFLAEYNFAALDETSTKMKIDEAVRKLLS